MAFSVFSIFYYFRFSIREILTILEQSIMPIKFIWFILNWSLILDPAFPGNPWKFLFWLTRSEVNSLDRKHYDKVLCCSFRKSREIVWFSFLTTLFSHLNRKSLKRTALYLFTYYKKYRTLFVWVTISWLHQHSSLLSRYLSWSINLAPNLSVNYSALLTPCTTDHVQPKELRAACSSHATEFFGNTN